MHGFGLLRVFTSSLLSWRLWVTDSGDGPHVPGHGPSQGTACWKCLWGSMVPFLSQGVDQDSNLVADKLQEKARGSSQQSWGQL